MVGILVLHEDLVGIRDLVHIRVVLQRLLTEGRFDLPVSRIWFNIQDLVVVRQGGCDGGGGLGEFLCSTTGAACRRSTA